MNRRLVTRAKRLAALIPGTLLLLSFLGTAASPLGIWSSHLERLSHFRFGWIVLLLLLLAFGISNVMHAPQGPVRIIGMHPRTPCSGHRFDERKRAV